MQFKETSFLFLDVIARNFKIKVKIATQNHSCIDSISKVNAKQDAMLHILPVSISKLIAADI